MFITEIRDEIVSDDELIRLDSLLDEDDTNLLLITLWGLAWDATMEGLTLQNCYPRALTALMDELAERGPITEPDQITLLEKIIDHATGALGDTWGSDPRYPGVDRLIALRPADDNPPQVLIEPEEDLVLDEHMNVHTPEQMPYPSGL